MYDPRCLLRSGLGAILALGPLLLPATAIADQAVVLNGSDDSLSRVDLETGVPELNLAALADPNHAVIMNDRLYVTASGSDEIHILDPETATTLNIIETGSGTNPFAVAVDAAGNTFVTLFNTGEVVRYDSGGQETARTAVGRSPEGILLSHGRLFVANTGFRFSDFGYDPGTVSVLDPLTLDLLGTVPVGLNPQWIKDAGNELHVVCTGDYFSVFGAVHIFAPFSLLPRDTIDLGGSPGYLELEAGMGFAADYFAGILSYEIETRDVVHSAANPIAFGGTGYSGMAGDGAGHLLVALFEDDFLARLRLSDETVDAVFLTGDGPVDLVVHTNRPVPVQLLAFNTRYLAGSGVEVTWKTTGGGDADNYLIERRGPDAEDWKVVAWASAKETRVVDPESFRPGSWYRLSVLRRDGQLEILSERPVQFLDSPPLLNLRPLANPSRGSVLFALERSNETPVLVTVHDVTGRLVSTRTVPPGIGTANVRISDIAAGVYFIRADNGVFLDTARITVLP